jgi:hypothetical protein
MIGRRKSRSFMDMDSGWVMAGREKWRRDRRRVSEYEYDKKKNEEMGKSESQNCE